MSFAVIPIQSNPPAVNTDTERTTETFRINRVAVKNGLTWMTSLFIFFFFSKSYSKLPLKSRDICINGASVLSGFTRKTSLFIFFFEEMLQ